MKKNTGFANLVLIGIVVLLVAAGGYFAWKGKSKNVAEQKVSETPSAIPSDWKTYKNAQYGFEIKLPSGWQTEEKQVSARKYYVGISSSETIKSYKEPVTNFATESVPPNIYIRYYEDIADDESNGNDIALRPKTLEKYTDFSVQNNYFFNPTKIYFAGQDAYKGEEAGEYGGAGLYGIWFLRNNHLYKIELVSDTGMDANLSAKILSTFKFTNTDSSATSSVKIGKVTIDPKVTADLQASVDEGHQPWRLSSGNVAAVDSSISGAEGFVQEDGTLNSSVQIVSVDLIKGVAVYIIPSSDGKKYKVTVIQPVVGKNKIWVVSDIEYASIADMSPTLQTYTDTQYGFEIKYPKNLYPAKYQNDLFVLNSTSLPLELGGAVPDGVNGKDFVTQGYTIYIDHEDDANLNIYLKDFPSKVKTLNDIDSRKVYQFFDSSEMKTPIIFIETSPASKNYLTVNYDYRCNDGKTCTQTEVEKVFNQILSTFKFTELAKQTTITILVPENIDNYTKELDKRYETNGFDAAKTLSANEPFIKKQLNVPDTGDIIKESAQAAAEVIPTQGGIEGAAIVYYKIQNNTAYIMIRIQLDGWAGVSHSIAEIEPIIEKNLLQFPQIQYVVFDVAPGDNVNNIKW